MKTIKLVSLFSLIALVLALSLFVLIPKRSTATTIKFSGSQGIEDVYEIGETIEIPSPDIVILETGSNKHFATGFSLELPNGAVVSQDKIKLEMAGNYTVTYFDNDGCKASKTFIVNKNVYEYVLNATAEYLDKLTMKESVPGISVNLKNGTAFKFNKVINLYNRTDSVLSVSSVFPILREEYNMMPKAGYVVQKITDVYDPDKYIEFYIWADTSALNMPYFVGGGASTQNLSGLEVVQRVERCNCTYEGNSYLLHTPSRYQSNQAYGRFISQGSDNQLKKEGGINFQWHLDSNKVFVVSADQRIVTDFDSPEIYNENVIDLSTFFTTGEVYYTLECFNLSASSVTVEIESIFDFSGSDLADSTVIDTTVPQVTIDIEETDESGIYLEKGKAFKVPDVKQVLDFNYYDDLKISVYRNYGEENEFQVFMKDGTFIPENVGKYTICYNAKDSFGNIGKAILNCNVIDEKALSFDEVKLEKIVGGDSNVIPAIEVTGINKAVDTLVKINDPRGNGYIVEYDETVNGYPFIPEYFGTYYITYYFSDNVYFNEYVYEVKSIDEGKSSFVDSIPTYPYYIKNATYDAFDFYSIKASENGKTQVLADAYVAFDSSSSWTKVNGSFKVTGNESLKIKYVSGETEVVSDEIKIVDVGYGEKTYVKDGYQKPYHKYFQGNYSDFETTNTSIDYKFNLSDDLNMDFINLISIHNFILQNELQGNGITSFSLTLKDYRNASNRIEIDIRKSGNKVCLEIKEYINSSIVAELIREYSGASFEGTLSFNVNGDVLSTSFGTTTRIIPFESDLVSMNLRIAGTGDAEFILKQINNQRFSSSQRITEQPGEAYFNVLVGTIDEGKSYTVSSCVASSVLSPVTKSDVKLSVFYTTGEYLKDVNGLELKEVSIDRNYDLYLEKASQIKVVYTISTNASDRNGATVIVDDSTYYVINVLDVTKPEIIFADGTKNGDSIEIKKGTTHKIKEYTLHDNATADEDLISCVLITDTHYNLLSNGYDKKEYKFTETGTYIVQIWAFDSNGNVEIVEYKVIVK